MSEGIYIHGHSDDLIEIEGEIQKELYANYGEPTLVTIGPWKFEVAYRNNGNWHITVLESAIAESFKKWHVGEHPGYNDYTQVVKIAGHSQYEVHKE